MPSGLFDANAAWVAIASITHNLLRAAAGLIDGQMSKVRAHTLRTLIIGTDRSPGQEADPAPAQSMAVGDGFRENLARGVEPTYTIIVLTDSLLIEHDAAGSGGDLGKHLWKRPVRGRDTTSCPLTASALESERTPGHRADRWIKANGFLS